jgi:hypothetical protein
VTDVEFSIQHYTNFFTAGERSLFKEFQEFGRQTAAFTGGWLEEEREKRNGAPTRRQGKEQSLRRLRRTCPTGAQFCLDERLAAGGARRRLMVWPCHYLLGASSAVVARRCRERSALQRGRGRARCALSLTAEIPRCSPASGRGKRTGVSDARKSERNCSSRCRLEGLSPLPFVSLAR